MIETRLEDLETKLAFQEDLIQKLDDALASQQQQLLEMQHKMGLLIEQVRMVEKTIPEAPEPPPPHY
ncbi:MAG: SlyX protein [Gammaproteobacteria bacterium]|jgi:SlyX protein|nr:SlyX protein [Gammaproteobacteria bacterium]|tara:strand:+ start:137 stop:337 length:201 start_codon:yes stop_codon:yes gene_type:complete